MQTTEKNKARAIAEENELTNQLVTDYVCREIMPFIPGFHSHIDFVVENDVLYLEIVVSRQ